MSKYIYPAIFTKESDGITVTFPDLQGCITCGDTLPEAILMAQDVLAFKLANDRFNGKTLPAPSDESKLQLQKNQAVYVVACDTEKYDRKLNKKAVRKSVSIPKWLNEKALDQNINFSEVLKNALISILGNE